MTIWWPRSHHFKMMTMVVLVVILWSSYDDHGHHSKMMTTSGVYGHHFGRMLTRTLTRTLTTSLLVKFVLFCLCIFFGNSQMHRPMPWRQILGQLRFLLTVEWQWRTKDELVHCLAISSWFELVACFCLSPRRADMGNFFDIRPWGYVHINAPCVCAKLAGGQW